MTRAWVLDTPALASFARGSIYMASLLRAFTDRETALLVPAVCLMEAHAVADAPDLVDLLCSFKPAQVVSLDRDAANAAGASWRNRPGATASAAHVAWLAAGFDAPIVTDAGARFAGLLPATHPIYTLPVE